MTTTERDRTLLELADSDPPAWILTPTRRLARALTLRVAELRASRGIEVADAPPIRSIDDWLRHLGAGVLAREAASGAATGGRVLLSPHAERLLWEHVIAQRTSDLPRELLDLSALAATASQAWSRLCLWGEPPWNEPATEDVEAFHEWLPVFRARLEGGGFVTTGELPSLVADAIDADALGEPLPRVAIAPSFERVTPALDKLTAALRRKGVRVELELDGASREPARVAVLPCATPSAELRTVASRIRTLLAASPQARVAVLAPDPAAFGSRLERIFEEELDPAAVLARHGSRRRFDYAEAPMLADYPLVASALDLLALPARRVDFEAASRVLLGEFPRGDDETEDASAANENDAARDDETDDVEAIDRSRVRRAVVEAALRRDRPASLRLAGSAKSLAAVLRRHGLAKRASAFERLAKVVADDAGTVRSPSQWRREWLDRLRLVRWPGPLRGDIEGLVFRRWRDVLDAFAMLESVQASMGATEALRRLREICESTPVQPPSEHHSVQVMSLLDAAGFDFDVVFAIGMTATAFPAPPRPNPLLPVRWQRENQMPRASVESERDLADRVWARVLVSAPEVVASFASSGDGSEDQIASACLAGLEPVAADAAEGKAWWSGSVRPPLEESPAEGPLPPLVRRGGSAILKHQSDCAFRAFSVVRLAAEKLSAIEAQPNALMRGNLVHEALAHAYGAIPTSTDLAGQSDENLVEIAADAAARTLEANAEFFDDAEDLAASARAWLADLVAAWMRHEREARSGEWEIASLEIDKVRKFPTGADDAIEFHFRPDRIDRLSDGSLVILDFKTSGTAKGVSAWKGERPEEPQLPLYLALLRAENEKVDGIAFGNLPARDRCKLAGAGAREFSDGFHPPSAKRARSRADFDAAVAGWLTAIDGLARAFLEGRITVDPRKAAVCEQCGTQAFCRVRELGGMPEDENGAGEDDE